MKFAWPVFWRVFLIQLVFSILIVLPLRHSAFITDPRFFLWKPSLMWAAFAALLVLAQLVFTRGLIGVLWGKRLNQGAPFWRKLSFTIAVMFIGLAVLSIIVGHIASFEFWLKFKTLASPVGLLLFVLLIPRRLAVIPNPSFKRDA
jgi:intracellular septation protein